MFRTRTLLRLTKVPGIGRKTAERLIVEMKDRLGPPSEQSCSADARPAGCESGSRGFWRAGGTRLQAGRGDALAQGGGSRYTLH